MEGAPYKPLTRGQNFTGGRNNNGRITSRHIGGGSKHKYRVIDFVEKRKISQLQLRELNMIQIEQPTLL